MRHFELSTCDELWVKRRDKPVALSALGQKAKFSLRSNVFSFAPESGDRALQSPCLFRANNGLVHHSKWHNYSTILEAKPRWRVDQPYGSMSTPGLSMPCGSSSLFAARSAAAKSPGRWRSYQGR